jgi:hypothetical protein
MVVYVLCIYLKFRFMTLVYVLKKIKYHKNNILTYYPEMGQE